MKRLLFVGCALFAVSGCTAAQRMALAHHTDRAGISHAATVNSVDIPRVVEPDAGPTSVIQNGVTVTASCTSIRFTASGYPGAGQADIGVGGNPPAVIYIVDGGFDVTFPMSSYDRGGALYFHVDVDGAHVAHGQIGTGC